MAVVWFVSKNIGAIREFNFAFKWQNAALSVFAVGFAYFLMVLVWLVISNSFNLNAPFLKVAKAYYVSLLGKYVPGKIFILLVIYAKRE